MIDIRKIIHVDMDAFFAAVEQRDFPEYRNKPLIVGGQPDSRGIVAACSYEARKFGIHSAMSSSMAWRRCPQAIFVAPRFETYKEVANQIRVIFRQYTDLIEPLSVDEAFLDVSRSNLQHGSATMIATDIRQNIKKNLHLTASAGISYNKFLAKLASEVNKPDGQFTITPASAQEWLKQISVSKFFGIGKVTAARMEKLGIHTGKDLLTWDKERLKNEFGKAGGYYYDMVRGIDERPIITHQERKSFGSERTFQKDLTSISEMLQVLKQMTTDLYQYMTSKSRRAQTITLKVKYPNFETVTRAYTASNSFDNIQIIHEQLPILLTKTDAASRTVRLLGVTFSKLSDCQNTARQQSLI